jgi:uncharacterized heparinase superfamily protein
MGRATKILRLWHTVRHLRIVQVFGRITHRIKPRPDLRPAPPLRDRRGSWIPPAARLASLVGPSTLRLLDEERDIDRCGWDDPETPLLWRYNQHYFDDLLAHGAETREVWHRALMSRWVSENPPGVGTGWAAYPVSLRVVNWVKWAMAGHALDPVCIQSLAVQARWLTRRLEWHLMGNHLFVNAKALIFAGLFFQGPEAERWFRLGAGILQEQIPEQILSDGGQFERSPMYHALALEDMLDLQNLLQACPDLDAAHGLRSLLDRRIPLMRSFLQAMTHPDGEIAFFNDAAMGVHPTPAELDAYALRLGHPSLDAMGNGVTCLRASGYVRVRCGDAVLLIDAGPVGPDYLPGHAHADTLSFELSVGGMRVLVNSGTSEYGVGAERLRQRGTAAHNALTLDGEDSSEVWGGFRVARRARVLDLEFGSAGDETVVTCCHDGFTRLRRGQLHRRRWVIEPGSLRIEDTVTFPSDMTAHFHWAPGVKVESAGPGRQSIRGPGCRLEMHAAEGRMRAEASTWHPRFGQSQSNQKTVIEVHGTRLVTHLTWS